MSFNKNNSIKNYCWLAFFKKYFSISFSLITLLIVILFSIQSYYTNLIAKKEAVSYAEQTVIKSENVINKLMDETLTCCSNILHQEDLRLFFTMPQNQILQNASLINTIKHNINISISGSNRIYSIYIYSNLNDYVISSLSYQSTAPISLFDDEDWHTLVKDEQFGHLKSRTLMRNNSKKSIITTVRPYYSGNNIVGYYVVNFNADRLQADILSFFDDNYSVHKAYLINPNGDVFCTVGSNVTKPNKFQKSFYSEASETPKVHISKENMLTSCIKSSEYNIGILLSFKFPKYTPFNGFQGILLILSILIDFFISAIIALSMTSKFYGTILNILDLLEKPETAPYSNRNRNLISKMLSKISDRNNYEDRILAEKIQKFKHLQNVSMQSQLNPHFIYNVLHLVNSYEMTQHKQETNVTVAISLFSDLLRSVLDNSSNFVTLEQELAICEKYLAIANMLVMNKFETIINIPNELKHHDVLKMSIQPILENSVTHGLRRVKHKGIIRITAQVISKNLVITIADNGKGMTPEQLEQLCASLETTFEFRGAHLGLYNINQRIRLIYGSEYGCTVQSNENGTTVTITVPFNSGK